MEDQISRNDQYLKDIREVIERNIGNDRFSVSDLAKEIGISRSMMHRKLIRLTGKSATELITQIRLARARELLANRTATVSEVAYKVGFSSPSYFNKVFKKAYQVTPGDVARKGPFPINPPAENDRSGKGMGTFTVLLAGIILLFVAILFLMRTVPPSSRSGGPSVREKSIAVLPFRNDSPDQENGYIINGYMEDLLNKLSMIKDLRVINRESVEQYRDQPNIREILKKFNVGYILTGSGQKYGDHIRIIVQLMDANQEIVWSKEYDRRIVRPEDHFTIQSNIAQLVAGEIDAIITPQERKRIEKVPTESLTALDQYQRGMNAFWDYWMDNDQRGALEDAAIYFHQALEIDSTFAEAYTGLARVYYAENFWEEYFYENFMDSALSLVNTSLYYENLLGDAYLMRGIIFTEKDLQKSAAKDLQVAIRLNPNSWENYYRNGLLQVFSNPQVALENIWKASTMNYGREYAAIMKDFALGLGLAGFNQKAEYYLEKVLDADGDSLDYYTWLAAIANWNGNYSRSIDYCLRALKINPYHADALDRIAYNYMFLGDHDQSFRYYFELEKSQSGSATLDINDRHRIGYIYWKEGYKEEARTYFDLQEQYCLEMIKLGRGHALYGFAHYDLAGVYAFRGEKERALENLRMFNRRKTHGIWMVTLISNDPLFDSIRDEPEFQQIVKNVKSKYQAEHDRIRVWLEQIESY